MQFILETYNNKKINTLIIEKYTVILSCYICCIKRAASTLGSPEWTVRRYGTVSAQVTSATNMKLKGKHNPPYQK